MICLYHLDDDGKCAGHLVNVFAPGDGLGKRFYKVDYDANIQNILNTVADEERVYIVDFSISPEMMSKLLRITSNVTWIDHHKTSIEKYDNFPERIKGIRDVNHSGSLLTWVYFQMMMPDNSFTYEELINLAPDYIKIIDDYDMWTFKLPETKEFHEGFALLPHEPEDISWSLLGIDSKEWINRIANDGKITIKYRRYLMNEVFNSYGFETEINGYKAYAVNQGIISSDDFENYVTENFLNKYDVLIGFIYDGEKYTSQLRTLKDIDISPIAVSYGGGGHPKACGFTHKDMILVRK